MVNGVRVIAREEAWSAFADSLFLYVAACRSDILTFQKRDRTFYEALMKLEGQLVKIDAKKRGIRPKDVRPPDKRVQAYLVQEMRLRIDPGSEGQEGLGSRTPPSGTGLAGRLLSMLRR